MKKIAFILFVAFISHTALVLQSCSKDEEKGNQPPTCIITSPINGQQIARGEIVTITVDANDSDGSITEVRFFINNVGKGAVNSAPYNYTWETDGEPSGNYTLKATSIDNNGESKSDEISVAITTTGTFTDPRDGQTYATIEIGSQLWFAENLNYETSNSWAYNNDPANGDIYGRFYTWDAALNACPSGWHLPSDEEWKTMEMALGMSQSEADDDGWRGTNEGEKMKSTSGWYDNGNGTNSSGFNALPGGLRSSDGSVGYLGYYGYWWSAAESSDEFGCYRFLGNDNNQVGRVSFDKTLDFSVRCVKD